ncbi:hypothetical protein HK104_010543 [Borealophlyctis nickersoniae]|nr:hypothetical protein HK104_010543 [Borealophlyctis nickersoniae]
MGVRAKIRAWVKYHLSSSAPTTPTTDPSEQAAEDSTLPTHAAPSSTSTPVQNQEAPVSVDSVKRSFRNSGFFSELNAEGKDGAIKIVINGMTYPLTALRAAIAAEIMKAAERVTKKAMLAVNSDRILGEKRPMAGLEGTNQVIPAESLIPPPQMPTVTANMSAAGSDASKKARTPFVFISYAWSNSRRAMEQAADGGTAVGPCDPRDVNDMISSRGVETFLDAKRLRFGDTLPAVLAKNIREATLVIPFLSEEYAQRPNCRQELTLAYNKHKKLVPAAVGEPRSSPLDLPDLEFMYTNTLYCNLRLTDPARLARECDSFCADVEAQFKEEVATIVALPTTPTVPLSPPAPVVPSVMSTANAPSTTIAPALTSPPLPYPVGSMVEIALPCVCDNSNQSTVVCWVSAVVLEQNTTSCFVQPHLGPNYEPGPHNHGPTDFTSSTQGLPFQLKARWISSDFLREPAAPSSQSVLRNAPLHATRVEARRYVPCREQKRGGIKDGYVWWPGTLVACRNPWFSVLFDGPDQCKYKLSAEQIRVQDPDPASLFVFPYAVDQSGDPVHDDSAGLLKYVPQAIFNDKLIFALYDCDDVFDAGSKVGLGTFEEMRRRGYRVQPLLRRGEEDDAGSDGNVGESKHDRPQKSSTPKNTASVESAKAFVESLVEAIPTDPPTCSATALRDSCLLSFANPSPAGVLERTVAGALGMQTGTILLNGQAQDVGLEDSDVTRMEHLWSLLHRLTHPAPQVAIEYMMHHMDDPAPVPSDTDETKPKSSEDIDDWDRAFMEVDQSMLFELILAANYMNIQELQDLGCKTVANMIKLKSVEEIRETFNITSDFTPEEEEQIRRENEWCEDR